MMLKDYLDTQVSRTVFIFVFISPHSVHRLSPPPTQFFSSFVLFGMGSCHSKYGWWRRSLLAHPRCFMFYVVLSKFHIWGYIFNRFPWNAMKDESWCWIGLDYAVDSVKCYHRKTNWMRRIGQLSKNEPACRSLFEKWNVKCCFRFFN